MASFGAGVESRGFKELLVLSLLGWTTHAHAKVTLYFAEPRWRGCQSDGRLFCLWFYWHAARLEAILEVVLETGCCTSN